ncbi:MAG: ornithine racemase Orr [Tissierellia bacterium]|nr:ornithine racemase Orr [Tissierellia bacterium]
MRYPRMTINTKQLEENARTLKNLLQENGIETLAAVTKVYCGNPEVAAAVVRGGVDYLADSRIQNLVRLQEFELPKILMRIPMLSEVDDVVKYADISFNSEIATLKALNEAAEKAGKNHKVVLMVDLGDLREGFYKEEHFYEAVELVLNEYKNLTLHGVGVNLTCYGAVIPKKYILDELVAYAKGIEERYGYKVEMVSGGNSSSVYLVGKEDLSGINNLRLGEVMVLGTESAYGELMEGLHPDVWTLEAQIIECKEKPSVPPHEDLGRDAFGRKPHFDDLGVRKRAIIAVGKQDVDIEHLVPHDEGLRMLGQSSDHTIVDVTDGEKDYQVGDVLKFHLDYVSVLSLNTSEYVEKVIES